MRAWSVTLIGALVLWSTRDAGAGNCMPCTDTSECRIADPSAFCVLHDADPGCGQLQICCPGQGCALDPSGFPSCYISGTCDLVVQQVDAGDVDSGEAVDGAFPFDAGAAFPDARTSTQAPGPASSSNRAGRDCSCGSASRASSAPALEVLSLLGLLAFRRKR